MNKKYKEINGFGRPIVMPDRKRDNSLRTIDTFLSKSTKFQDTERLRNNLAMLLKNYYCKLEGSKNKITINIPPFALTDKERAIKVHYKDIRLVVKTDDLDGYYYIRCLTPIRHPHISASNRICYGEAYHPSLSAKRQNRLFDSIKITETVLQTYCREEAFFSGRLERLDKKYQEPL